MRQHIFDNIYIADKATFNDIKNKQFNIVPITLEAITSNVICNSILNNIKILNIKQDIEIIGLVSKIALKVIINNIEYVFSLNVDDYKIVICHCFGLKNTYYNDNSNSFEKFHNENVLKYKLSLLL